MITRFLATTEKRPTLSLGFLALLYAVFSFSAQVHAGVDIEEIKKAMSEYLVCSPVETVSFNRQQPIIVRKSLCLSTIYNGVKNYPLWVTGDGLSEKGRIIVRNLQHADIHGLNPQKYNIDTILSLVPSKKISDLAKLETLLSYGLVLYIHDLDHGQLEPHQSDPQLFAEAGSGDFDPLKAIQNCLAANDLDAYLAGIAPQHLQYKGLMAALAHYRQVEAAGGWPIIPTGPTLRPGDTDPRIRTVWLRLLKSDQAGLPASPPTSLLYDDMLKTAVLRFQVRHHLETDGVIGPKTLAAMNVPVSERIETIRLNMDRWRWQAHDLGEKYVIVNIADFTLEGIKDNKVELEMPVIVGKRQHQTPVFSARVKYLDFNPFWNIPDSIVKNEELPKLQKNPYSLVERHVRLFSGWDKDAIELDSTAVDWLQITPRQVVAFRMRQDPGAWNALGKLKFVFPNKYSVYMHGTPEQGYFQRKDRGFSHGCIRVSNPSALAEFILADQDGHWTDEKIAEIYNQDIRKVVLLSHPIPVHITYQTSWVDKDGAINFNNDTYARDEKLQRALNE